MARTRSPRSESGAVVETDTDTDNTVRNGKIARVPSYMERSQAFEAAGLRE
jgi:ketosteroid isomerase-like protein